MDELRKEKQLQLSRESLLKRVPLIVLIFICFLIYNFWLPLEIFKWASLVILVAYFGVGLYYRKKIRTELDKIPYEEEEEPDNQEK
ncbi:MAG: hypothetical protein K9N06_06475 [Candidatus Cloacimonetes bacterium]|nr:hypothetical protein [Candidatus Cloacimonadota bacterium]